MPLSTKTKTSQNWMRLTNTIRQLIQSKQGPTAIRYGITLVILVILFNVFNVINSYVGRDFISSIEQKNTNAFYTNAILYGIVFVISSAIGSLNRYTEERLGILWREQLTWKFTDNYLAERTFQQIIGTPGIENPDQRITDDVKTFTTTTISFTLLFIGGIFSAISFSGVLWSINPILFLVAVAYALSGTVSTIFLGKSLIRLNYDQLDMEASYRADLLHIRQHAESIAVTHREARMSVRLKSRLRKLVNNFRKLISVNLRLSFFTNNYNYFIQIIPMLIIAPSYMRGEIEFGVITQAALAFTTLLNAFSLIVTQFQSISAFSAVVKRLHSLETAMFDAENEAKQNRESNFSSDEICFENFTLYSNDRSKLLVDHLQLTIHRKERWLITSFDDAVKLSLFRSIAGISNHSEGNIKKPSWEEILFLPEKPYLPPGRLRNVIVPAYLNLEVSDSEILKELKNMGLESLVRRFGGIRSLKEWDEELSLAEKYKIALVRVLFVKPKFLILDRPGSILGKYEISKLLKLFHRLGVTTVVIAKDEETVLEYDYHLNISHFGEWTLSPFHPTNTQT
ncbi:ABC transporter ATP-binding protein/permease [Leptospira sp. 2 VSF19]|uniref:ABC transporter ATP-binding protein/permease n=1 Tax=Leptospira soteropolitanensis TaxID=2950025 RepID=A0AAW5VHD6_9LEPT|nr:SbmA/BacA-like family transporter [Leptospira soteropolitanensis]MCW7493670.1 ABC transporter ATP-binding protein/permease [Leptospira soteropolitanensis]MCW7501268.1 ABC transporter ATP-binding protein/permease [Leptospira soteropolitanensis]MCW7523546.1 ABC transporter ATP-binding protein/permease [Leptospira soteropolitanensis]MCW7527382.1 ABC transporter ATP-binding protein/permease [Leptospira soteropolitanensis]MCW7531238.1 ABC transporter ATP-binding protein/permease [Leptospira sote